MWKRPLIWALGFLAMVGPLLSFGEEKASRFKEPVTHASLALGDLLQTTHEVSVMAALQTMEGTELTGVEDRIVDHGTRIIMKNMLELGKRYKTFDALTVVTGRGQQVIYINLKHASAPPEALAALLSHEMIHDDPFNSYTEETVGWTREAAAWEIMKQHHPALIKIPTGVFPLVDRLNVLEKALQQGNIGALVRANMGYKGLPEHSPGY